MIYTVSEYSKKFKFGGKFVSIWTIIRRCNNGMLPCNHVAKKLSGRRGAWVIEVKEK